MPGQGGSSGNPAPKQLARLDQKKKKTQLARHGFGLISDLLWQSF